MSKEQPPRIRFRLLNWCANRLLLHPTTHPVPADGLVRQRLAFGGGHAEVWVHAAPRPADLLVLQFTGNATRAERMARRFLCCWPGRCAEVWTVNYPGFGGSTGPARVAAIPGLALRAFDELQAVAVARPVLVVGESLGCAAALHVTANRAAAGVLLRNPPPLRSLIVGRYGWWNLWLPALAVASQVPPELDSPRNAARSTAPAVFLQSAHDTVVPPRYQQKVFAAYAGPKRRIVQPHADHNHPLAEAQVPEISRTVTQMLNMGKFD